jgi:hypothetical protein
VASSLKQTLVQVTSLLSLPLFQRPDSTRAAFRK